MRYLILGQLHNISFFHDAILQNELSFNLTELALLPDKGCVVVESMHCTDVQDIFDLLQIDLFRIQPRKFTDNKVMGRVTTLLQKSRSYLMNNPHNPIPVRLVSQRIDPQHALPAIANLHTRCSAG